MSKGRDFFIVNHHMALNQQVIRFLELSKIVPAVSECGCSHKIRRIFIAEQYLDVLIENISIAEGSMIPNKVVTRSKDHTMRKGTTRNFLPNRTQFHLEEINGEILEIHIEDLKAVFFVKDFEGNKSHQKSYDDNIAGGGKKIKVRFFDGETVVGYTLGFSPDRQGFFLTPGDLKGNNERIFVVKSATEKIEFL